VIRGRDIGGPTYARVVAVLGIDHLVLAVRDPDAAAATLEAELGLRATGGGRHPALGTFNRLIWLGDSYLELLGIEDETLAAAAWIGAPALALLGDGREGLATWAVAVTDLDAEIAAARASGGVLAGPIAGERVRPDGRVVRWRLALGGPLGPAEPPFLIEHDTTAAEWTEDERAARAAERHPVGGPVRLSSFDIAPPTIEVAVLGTRVPERRRTLFGCRFVLRSADA
jgi:catechol 2,3-dioxygenase-like lactoylglutathione lyase family enzyme